MGVGSGRVGGGSAAGCGCAERSSCLRKVLKPCLCHKPPVESAVDRSTIQLNYENINHKQNPVREDNDFQRILFLS